MTIDVTTLRLGDEVTTTDGDTGRVCEIAETARKGRYFIGLTGPDGASDHRILCHQDGSPVADEPGVTSISSFMRADPAASSGSPQERAETVTVPLGHLIRLLSECNRLIGRHSWDKTDTMSALVEAVDAITAEVRR